MHPSLEICCYNYQSCLIAAAAGADRIELCADAFEGGTTPAMGTIRMVKEKVQIPVYPIIRPRGGDFFYNTEEWDIMKTEIALCKQLHCEGVVIGMLKQDGSVDKELCKQLVALAYPMGVTFHRAFDRAVNPFEALEDIISMGCERILTSGHKPVATEGEQLLDELVRQANDRIIIMPGSGVRANNVAHLAKKTGATEFHSSARIKVPSKMQFINEGMKENLDDILADKNEIVAMKEQLTGYFNSLTGKD